MHALNFTRPHRHKYRGFTLIELVVVIVILGILAGIASFAYRSFIGNANKTAEDALLNSFAKSYTGSRASGSTVDAAVGDAKKDIEADVKFKVSPTSAIVENLATASAPITLGAGASMTNPNITHLGKTDWRRVSTTIAAHGVRHYADLAKLQPNTNYRIAFAVANDTATPKTFYVDWSDEPSSATHVVMPANSARTVEIVGTRASYTSSIRFVDIALSTPGDSLLVADVIIELAGNESNYFNGNTPDTAQYDYSWLGTPGASVSRKTLLGGVAGLAQIKDTKTDTTYCYGLPINPGTIKTPVLKSTAGNPGENQYTKTPCI